jgi:hypothetical protein
MTIGGTFCITKKLEQMSKYLNQTSMLTDLAIADEVEQVIDKVKNYDGETMEFILRETGQHYQMLRQLVMGMDWEDVKYLVQERMELDKKTLNEFL